MSHLIFNVRSFLYAEKILTHHNPLEDSGNTGNRHQNVFQAMVFMIQYVNLDSVLLLAKISSYALHLSLSVFLLRTVGVPFSRSI